MGLSAVRKKLAMIGLDCFDIEIIEHVDTRTMGLCLTKPLAPPIDTSLEDVANDISKSVLKSYTVNGELDAHRELIRKLLPFFEKFLVDYELTHGDTKRCMIDLLHEARSKAYN